MNGRLIFLLAASLLVPVGGILLIVVAEGLGVDLSAWRAQPWFGWLAIALLTIIGAGFMLRLDWPLRHRLLTITAYMPLMAAGLVLVLLASACAVLGECL